MNILKLLLFLIFPVSSFIYITTSVSCPTPSICGNISFPIKYPFHLNNTQQKLSYCLDDSRFGLTCNNQSRLILNIPLSGNFIVKDISYPNRRIYLADPDDCLPKRILEPNFSLIASPFSSPYSAYYSLFSCPPDIKKDGYSPIPCLSNSSVSVVAGYRYSSFLLNKCNMSGRLSKGPGVSTYQYYGTFDEIVLTWSYYYDLYSSFCDDCAYVNPSTKPAPTTGSQPDTSIALGISIPLVILGLLTCIIIRCQYSNNRSSSEVGAISDNTTTTAHQDFTSAQPPTMVSGLENSVIELYSVKVVCSWRKF